jgi:hypothetical protein
VADTLRFNALTIAEWQAFLALRQEFDAVVGGSIYTLLTDVVDTTFGFAADAPVPPRLVIFTRRLDLSTSGPAH